MEDGTCTKFLCPGIRGFEDTFLLLAWLSKCCANNEQS